nr:S24 family peptidase [uncultured Celeribacter sp.]
MAVPEKYAPDEYRSALGRRIEQAVSKAKNKGDVAYCAGISTEQLNKWIKGNVKVPADGLRAISMYTNVDFSWLVTGESEANSTLDEGKDRASSRQLTAEATGRGMINLPLYSVEASAGHGSLPATEEVLDQVAFQESFLRDLGAHPFKCSIIWAKGDSMQPTIPDGSILIVDLSQNEINNGCLYVFNVDGDLLVKRARRKLDSSIELISDNNLYATETVSKSDLDQLRVIGRVVYFCRTP